MTGFKLVDKTVYDTETRARDNAWESLVGGFAVTVTRERGRFVVRTYEVA